MNISCTANTASTITTDGPGNHGAPVGVPSWSRDGKRSHSAASEARVRGVRPLLIDTTCPVLTGVTLNP